MKSGRGVIEVRGLRVEREAVIIERIDWCVGRGENWALLGANGSGKTSLLRALTGYLPPTAGEIRVLGETYGRFDWRGPRAPDGPVNSRGSSVIEEWGTAARSAGRRA